MSQPLTIWLPDELSGTWHWAHGDRFGSAISAADKASLGELDACPVHVIIAGQSVRQVIHELPPMKEADRLAAAGFAAENMIAAPLSDQHLVLGPSGTNKIAIITQAYMQDIRAALEQAGIRPDGLYADYDVVPPSRPILLPDRAIYPGAPGYTLDRSWAELGEQEDQLSQVMASVDVERAVNLLTGAYAKSGKFPVSLASAAKVAALLLVAFTAWLGLNWSQARAISQQASALRADTAALYSAATGAPAPSNPALAVTRAIKGGGDKQVDFLALSNLLFRALEPTDSIMIESLQFDFEKNQLSLRLIYPQFESSGALETAITNLGGEFRSGGVREQSGRLIGDAVLGPAP